MQSIVAFAASVLAKVLVSFLNQLKRDADLKEKAIDEAAAATQQVIKETADARSQISDSATADDLVRRMREATRNS
ncbi:hypothetical protein [Phyllobacterium endophyticum]|uniref:hypothetical protein n=1 Tax=Phyllobacterium endophyticum TaxID=1149773 RepID=UPI0011C7F97A|nr:hypothetical protein [Phyllobacterium endophyticum]TXR49910.1 hypothetical protein FVA77_07810 [Phyllobacterium endophyticum]